MKSVTSSDGKILIPAAIRQQDDIQLGEQFEVEREAPGEYLVKRLKQRRNEGLVQLLLNCPVKGWFQPLSRNERTHDILPSKLR